MDLLKVIEAVNMILVVIGVVLVTIPKIEGLYVLIFAQIGWCIFSLGKGLIFFFIQSAFLLAFNFVGIYNWKRKNIG